MSDTGPDSAPVEGPKDEHSGADGAPTRTEVGLPTGEGAGHDTGILTAGAVVGPYRIVALLGRGGMGLVYEAEEIDSSRHVALKVLSPGFQREVDRARFLREGRLAASLDHPNCVYVFGAWELDGRLVIAMELMRETLADRLKQGGRLPFDVAVDAILQVIAGLDAAATAGILHRDVKPSNCFVDEQGRVEIGDFGISISAHPTSGAGLATGRRIVGTPAYASPEQLRGDRVDTRTDVYGVGATLYELVTGHPPFDKPDLMSLLMAVGLEGAAVIATDAVVSVATSIIKISVFGLAGVVTAQVLAFAVLIGVVALPGAFLAKAFVERMPVHIHTAILDAAVIVGGLVMISAAMR